MDQAHAMEIVDLIRFQDEIRCLIADGDGAGGAESSFTALLGLAPHQAAELLAGGPPAMPPPPVKCEPEESDCGEDSGTAPPCRRPSGKRKEPERKVKSGGSKKSRSSEDEEGDNKGGDDGKLPYVHVRARRGQATDSHSLAERARREKINARMKLLQELVPGCSKISGTALVLDEIINHVQSLQRQVEFLSMKLAAVNPRIDFSGLDSFLAADNLRLAACNGGGSVGLEAPLWAEVPIDGEVRRHHHSQQQMLLADMASPQLPSSLYERTHHHQHQHHHHNAFDSTCPPSLFSFDSSTASVSLSANQLKMEAEF